MAQQHLLTIADKRAVAPGLRWLTLHAPDLAHVARAGHYLLVRCAEPGSYDPLLRRPLFIAAAEPALGQLGLLYAPSDRGLAWLARGQAGDTLDAIGLLGHPFALDNRTNTLLLIGAGRGLPALLLLARELAGRGGSVTLLAGAEEAGLIPPAFLLPSEVEYQTTVGPATELLLAPSSEPVDQETRRQGDKGKKRKADQGSVPPPLPVSLSPISWADQICAALPNDQLAALANAIRAVKYRWEPGFASALLDGPLVCGVGACGVCPIELRRGTRMLCSDGPVFDLRDVQVDRKG